MIGVVAHEYEKEMVAEFFELFKTPWEFYQSHNDYEVLICTHEPLPESTAVLLIYYNSQTSSFDALNELQIKTRSRDTTFSYAGKKLPIYCKAGTFPVNQPFFIADESSREPAGVFVTSGGSTIARIGYDLFQEVRFLLTVGQPPVNAKVAALEWHIELLRDLITGSGIPLVEIPPVPDGYNFTACLTHDIDHPVVRNHRCDHTMVGFLWRATFGSLMDVCRGRKSLMDLGANLMAVCSLPFVHLGMARDFWSGFDRYLQIEAGLGATYFVIPKKDCPGEPPVGKDVAMRGARYEINEIKPQLERIISSGCEIGLHGIDAWTNSTKGKEEGHCITSLNGAVELGVRMHWLLFDEKSPIVLDQAGFSYDSTFGYNETVGFRPGTAQVYRPPGVTRLLELPLQIMDTALFYPCYSNYSNVQAKDAISELLENVERFGGALTINWHDRSIAPERLWESFYLQLLAELKTRRAWFATASQAVSWFRKRRAVRLSVVREEDGTLNVTASVQLDTSLPGLIVRVHKPRARLETGSVSPLADYYDVGFNKTLKERLMVSGVSEREGTKATAL